VAENYTSYEEQYNFSNLTFPTPITEIKIFEKNNLDVSVNVFGLKHEKNKKHIIYPLLTEIKATTHTSQISRVLLENKKHHMTVM